MGASGARPVGGAGIVLVRVVVVEVVVPLLDLVVGLVTCTAGRLGSVVDKVPVAVRKEAGPALVGRVAV